MKSLHHIQQRSQATKSSMSLNNEYQLNSAALQIAIVKARNNNNNPDSVKKSFDINNFSVNDGSTAKNTHYGGTKSQTNVSQARKMTAGNMAGQISQREQYTSIGSSIANTQCTPKKKPLKVQSSQSLVKNRMYQRGQMMQVGPQTAPGQGLQIAQLLKESKLLAANNSQKTDRTSANKILKLQAKSSTPGKKLFAQEFYNLGQNKRRDLAGFSLHNHPDSRPDGVFSKWQASEATERQKRGGGTAEVVGNARGSRLMKSQQNLQRQLQRNASVNQTGLGKSSLLVNQAHRLPIHYGGVDFVASDTGLQLKLRAGVGSKDANAFPRQPAQLKPNSSSLETDRHQIPSYLLKNPDTQGQQQQQLVQIQQHPYNSHLTYENPGHHEIQIKLQQQTSNYQKLQPNYQSSKVIGLRKEQDRSYLGSEISHHYTSRQRLGGAAQFDMLISETVADEPGQLYNNLHHHNKRGDDSNRRHASITKQDRNKLLIEMEKNKKKRNETVFKELQEYKSHHRESYGIIGHKGSKSSKAIAGSRLRADRIGVNNSAYIKPVLVGIGKTERVPIKQVRHPTLKHELQGLPMTHLEQKLHDFARNGPLFKQRALNKTQVEVLDKAREPSIFETTSNQQLANRSDHDLGDFYAKLGQDQERKSDEELLCETDSSQQFTPKSTSNIKDKAGFDQKIQLKLDQMIDPKNVQIFNVENSQKLYFTISKQQKLEREDEQKFQNRQKKKNVSQQPSLPVKPTAAKKGLRKSSKGSLSPKKRSIKNKSAQQSEEGKSPTSVNSVGRKNSLRVQEQPRKQNTSVNQVPSGETRRSKNKKQTRPNFYAMKGRIDVDALKKGFQNDLINNLKLADKMGVLNVINDMRVDAEVKMQWRQRLRANRGQKDQSLQPIESDEEFPGYFEQFEITSRAIAQERLKVVQKEIAHSSAVIGHRSKFNFGESSKVDLACIYDDYQKDSIKVFTEEMFRQLLTRGEVLAFMSQIRASRLRLCDPDAITDQERDLAGYIKYLIGETKNKDFAFKREDFSQKHELNKKSLHLPFDEYAAQEENAMKTVANDIIERMDYRSVVQNAYGPASVLKLGQDPRFAYFQVCQKDSDLAIPLLAKVVNRQLSLMNYQLSIGHVRAFVRTFDFNSEFVSRFLFKNCGLTDAHIEILLDKMRKLDHVSSLVFQKEDFGLKSVQAIKPLIARPRPNALQVLRLIDCKMPPVVTRELIQTLREFNQVKVLGLVNARISEASMQELALVVSESKCLTELDISWNILKPQSYNALIASLGSNRTLLTLNLSWNRLVDSSETVIDEPAQANSPSRSDRGSQNEGKETPWYEKEAQFTALSQAVLENLVSLLKRNKKLQHVNLANTGLTEYMLVGIGRGIRRAKSLLSIHLCDNPGSSARVKDYLAQRIRCMPLKDKVRFPVGEIVNEMTNSVTRDVLLRQLGAGDEADGEKPVARETIKIKQNMERKRIHTLVNEFGDEQDTGGRMIFTRILGHKRDMPGSGQWKLISDMNEKCWICEQEVYGLVFWDGEEIQKKAHASTKNPQQEKLMRRVVNRLHKVTSKEVEDGVADANPRVPIIMGDFTDWKPRPLFEVTDYSESLVEQFDIEFIIRQMQYDKVLSYRRGDRDQFTQTDWLNYKRYSALFYERDVALGWKQVVKSHLLYKKPHMVFAADTRPDFYKSLFVMAAMFQVGKHEFIVRAPQQVFDRETFEYVENTNSSGQPEYSYFTNVSDIRAEDIHPFLKQVDSRQVVRRFVKETSVFSSWKQDTKASIAAAFQIDWDNTRIPKLIKDATDLARTRDYLESNYEYLKEQYLELQYNSVYPFVNKLETATFCERAGLADERLNTSACDLLFVSCSTTQKGGIKQKTGLIRCEFLEYLVRLANYKYLQTQQAPTFHAAVRTVLENYVKVNIPPIPWQSFRDQELWTIEVNDVLEANLDGIRKIHNAYFTPTQKFMSDKDAINLLTKDALVDLTYQQSKYCLSFCKMPIKDEIGEFEKYHKLQLVELCELIGRAAKVKHAHTEFEEEPLARKIEMVLDLMFPLVKFKRREVFVDAESESCSDEEY